MEGPDAPDICGLFRCPRLYVLDSGRRRLPSASAAAGVGREAYVLSCFKSWSLHRFRVIDSLLLCGTL